MRLIFLDVDGVLNNRRSMLAGVDLDPLCVHELRRILSITKARVVLSSVWRLYPQFLAQVRKAVPEFTGWKTPEIRNVCRGEEIATWLDLGWSENVEQYCILDDDADMLEHQKPFLVQTTFEEGLTEYLANIAINILMEGHDDGRDNKRKLC